MEETAYKKGHKNDSWKMSKKNIGYGLLLVIAILLFIFVSNGKHKDTVASYLVSSNDDSKTTLPPKKLESNSNNKLQNELEMLKTQFDQVSKELDTAKNEIKTLKDAPKNDVKTDGATNMDNGPKLKELQAQLMEAKKDVQILLQAQKGRNNTKSNSDNNKCESGPKLSGASGKIFKFDKKLNEYDGEWSILELIGNIDDSKKNSVLNSVKNFDMVNECKSKKWIVTTTIFDATPVIKIFDKIDDWCTIIIGDKKSPKYEKYMKGLSKVVFMDDERQDKFYKEFKLESVIPWNHFGRKNLGYIYAILNGAEYIYDTDDDNELINKESIGIVNHDIYLEKGIKIIDLEDPKCFDGARTPKTYKNGVFSFNIFQKFKKNDGDNVWPRGFDFDLVAKSLKFHKDCNLLNVKYTDTELKRVDQELIVHQWCADIEPDFDGIGRILGNNPYVFDKKKQFGIVIPNEVYIPYNSQVTIYSKNAFWGIYLPISVNGRVSDIWRGYILQSILYHIKFQFNNNAKLTINDDIKKRLNKWFLVYLPSLVVQNRNEHSNLADFNAEIPVYEQTPQLLKFLRNNIKFNGVAKLLSKYNNDLTKLNDISVLLFQMILDIYINLYEYGVIGLNDVNGIKGFITDMYTIGYTIDI